MPPAGRVETPAREGPGPGAGSPVGDSPEGYRAEVDGLRGIAVLAVVLFHARVPGFTGGYVGVDVFFVVSGYLITRLVLRDCEGGAFSISRFYERRVRRLMPALFAVLAAATLASWMLLPGDLKRFSGSLVAVVAFLSNLLFWHWTGYFSVPAQALPLLHTWSLAVEEQFYLVFPALVGLLARRSRRAVAPVTASIALASLIYSIWAVNRAPAAAFYSPLSRAWELMLGAWLASGILPRPSNRAFNDGLAALGLLLVGSSIWRLTASSPFPGLGALAPCLGAALVVRGSEVPRSRVCRLLRARPLVAVGLASYSLYLWHWPMIVFGTYYVLDSRSATFVRAAMALLSIPIAFASWRFVERPFRGPRRLLSRRALLSWGLALSSGLALLGLIGYRLDGFPGRFDRTVARLSTPQRVPVYPCANAPLETIEAGRLCRIGDPTARATFALWGDSHAGVYQPALDALAKAHAVGGSSVIALGCPPLVGMTIQDKSGPGCRARNDRVLRALESERPRVVILAANWFGYFGRPDPESSWDAGLAPGARGKHGPGYSPSELRSALERTARALRRTGATTYFVECVPRLTSSSPDLLAKAYLLGNATGIEPRTSDFVRENAEIAAAAVELERQGLLRVLSPGRLLCDTESCRVTDRSGPLYFDRHHLNERGARFVAGVFEPVMAELRR